MKITFLGAHSALSSSWENKTFHSNILLEENGKRLLVDCGTDIPYSLENLGYSYKDIDAVYISHIHADHAGGLEWLGFKTYFDPSCKRPKLFAHPFVIDKINNILKYSLKISSGNNLFLSELFSVGEVQGNPTWNENNISGQFNWENNKFYLIKNVHANNLIETSYSYGLLVNNTTNKLYISTDSIDASNIFNIYFDKDALIFQDCETINTSPLHAHYDDLNEEEFGDLKNKIWLYHTQPNIISDEQAVKDGFAGIVDTGQLFEI